MVILCSVYSSMNLVVVAMPGGTCLGTCSRMIVIVMAVVTSIIHTIIVTSRNTAILSSQVQWALSPSGHHGHRHHREHHCQHH